ncbi:MAG: DUF3570 domain-containing protein [bacterium]
MQLSRLQLAVTALLLAPPAHAGLDPESRETGLHFELFSDSDRVHVYSETGSWQLDLAKNTGLSVGLTREIVVVPGITAAPGSQQALDSISSASRPISSTSNPYADWSKARNALDSTLRWQGFSAGYYVSSESDYFAQQVAGGYERPLFDDNLTLSFGGSYGWDRIKPLADQDTATPDAHKDTVHGDVVATWTATPTTIVQGGAELSRVEGLQHNPYRNVYVAGAYVPESQPDERNRRDFFLKVNRYLPNRSSLKLDYKLYADDWGILSHTFGAKLLQYVGESVVVRYRYRWYTQGAADFWRDEYLVPGGVGGYQTADYRMGAFDSHLFGTELTWKFGRAPFKLDFLGNVGLDVQYERYFNTNNFSANIFQTGLVFTY